MTAQFYNTGSQVTESGESGKPLVYCEKVRPEARRQDWSNRVERIVPEAVQIGAALLVPLATLAVTQANEGTSGDGGS